MKCVSNWMSLMKMHINILEWFKTFLLLEQMVLKTEIFEWLAVLPNLLETAGHSYCCNEKQYHKNCFELLFAWYFCVFTSCKICLHEFVLVTKRLITVGWVQYPAIFTVYNIGELIAIEPELMQSASKRTFEAINMTNKYYIVGSHIRTTIIQIKFSWVLHGK